MRYTVIAIGNLKRGFLKEGCDFYAKRLSALADFSLIEVKASQAVSNETVKTLESESLLKQTKGYTVALDEKGKTFTTSKLAKHVSALELKGISQVNLLIGGANGHSEALKNSVNEVWRLSDLTLAHELARLVLLEQLYRVESLRAGHPYHR